MFVHALITCVCSWLSGAGCPEDSIFQVLDDLVGKAGLSVVSGCTMLGLGTCAVNRCEVCCGGCPEANILQVVDDLVGTAGLSVVSGCRIVLNCLPPGLRTFYREHPVCVWLLYKGVRWL
jgi:hypothetical protein